MKYMPRIVAIRTCTGPARSGGNMRNGGLETMETTSRRKAYRAHRHVDRAAKRALKEAGPRKDVARVLGRSISTISHEVRDRCHPTLKGALAILTALVEDAGVSGRAFAEAVAEIVELAEIIDAETDTLVARGLYLIEYETRADAAEDLASMIGDAEHAEALRVHGSACMELAAITEELLARDISLHALHRQAVAA